MSLYIQTLIIKWPSCLFSIRGCRLNVLDQCCAKCVCGPVPGLNCLLLVHNEAVWTLRGSVQNENPRSDLTLLHHPRSSQDGLIGYRADWAMSHMWWNSVGILELSISPWKIGQNKASKQTSPAL